MSCSCVPENEKAHLNFPEKIVLLKKRIHTYEQNSHFLSFPSLQKPLDISVILVQSKGSQYTNSGLAPANIYTFNFETKSEVNKSTPI